MLLTKISRALVGCGVLESLPPPAPFPNAL
jgi:hypothetical protein